MKYFLSTFRSLINIQVKVGEEKEKEGGREREGEGRKEENEGGRNENEGRRLICFS